LIRNKTFSTNFVLNLVLQRKRVNVKVIFLSIKRS